MVQVKFQKNYENLIQKINLLCAKNELEKVIFRAARRASQSGVTVVKKEISKETTLKQSTIAKAVKSYVHGEPRSELASAFSIGVRISDTTRPLSEFSFKPKIPKPHTAPMVEIYRGKQQKFENGAFVQKMPSGHIGIFEREGKSRLPIKELRGPSITGIFKAQEGIQDSVFDRIYEILEKRINHEMEYLLSNK